MAKLAKPASLYHITDEIRDILDLILNPDELEEEALRQVFLDRLDELEGDINNKVANTSFYYHEVQSAIKARKEEEVRLRDQRKILENGLERLKSYVGDSMDRAGRTEIVNEKGFGFKFAKSPDSVEVTDRDKLEKWQNENVGKMEDQDVDEFVVMEIILSERKKPIMEYFKKTGECPDGARIVGNKRHLRVK